MEILCRLCGNRFQSSIDDFWEDQETCAKITEVLQIKIRPEDDLPKFICSDCRNRLDDAFNFINCCHDTQYRLGELLVSGARKNESKKLLSVEHPSHVTNDFISESSLCLLNNSDNIDDLFPKSDVDSQNFVFPPRVKTVKITLELENGLPEANIAQESHFQNIGGNTNFIAEGNSDPKRNQANAAMENEIRAKQLFSNTYANSDIKNDVKGKRKKKLTEKSRSLASKIRTRKRIRTARMGISKISKKTQKKKIVSENRGDFDYLAGLEIAREQKKWTCDTCQMTFSQENIYREHLSVHSGNRPYNCKLCTSCFRKRQELNQHLRTVHADKQNNKFIATHDFNIKKLSEKPFACEFCAYHTDEKDQILQHIIDKHSGNLSFACEICGIAFRTLPLLQAHRVNAHVSKSVLCQKCMTLCPSVAEYRVHVLKCGKNKTHLARERCSNNRASKKPLRNQLTKLLNINSNVLDKQSRERNELDAPKFEHRKISKGEVENNAKKHPHKSMNCDNTVIATVRKKL